VGLDQGPQSFSSRILALTLSLLAFILSTVLGYLVFKGDHFAIKKGPNPGPRQIRKEKIINLQKKHNSKQGNIGLIITTR
jgi:hypothetical protein